MLGKKIKWRKVLRSAHECHNFGNMAREDLTKVIFGQKPEGGRAKPHRYPGEELSKWREPRVPRF